jgi:tetratricopeptide (TPR) repeat protein
MKREFLFIGLLFLAGCGAGSAMKMIDDDPDVITINREAQLAYEGGENAKAEALYKSLVRKMPNDAETWFRLGNLYARANRPDEAANAYQRSLIASNANPRAWHNLGVIRLRQAWAAMLQARENLKPGTPLYQAVDQVLNELEKMPIVDADGKGTAAAQKKAEAGAAPVVEKRP